MTKPVITCSPDKTIACDAEIVFDTFEAAHEKRTKNSTTFLSR
jgi:hypothetical protein